MTSASAEPPDAPKSAPTARTAAGATIRRKSDPLLRFLEKRERAGVLTEAQQAQLARLRDGDGKKAVEPLRKRARVDDGGITHASCTPDRESEGDPAEQLLAAIRNCPTNAIRGHCVGSGASAADVERDRQVVGSAVSLVQAFSSQGANKHLSLPKETTRAAIGAACRVGNMRLVRVVLEMVEAVPLEEPVHHQGRRGGGDPITTHYDATTIGMVLKFLIDRGEFWRAFHLVRYVQSHPAFGKSCLDSWMIQRLHEAEQQYGDRQVFDPASLVPR